MGTRKGVWRFAVVSFLCVLIGIPALALAKPNPSWSDDARCDKWAVGVSNAVEMQLPKIAFPPSVRLWFELMQRENLVPPADHRIFYGVNYTKFGDLRLPHGAGPFPVAILIHGGGWQSAVTLDYMAPLADALTCAGIATWSIEYRRLGAGGEWPAMFLDVGAAADFLRELAKHYPLDLSRVVTVGHSSGGHLALWLAARDRLPVDAELYTPDPLPILGVVALAGAADIVRFVQLVPMYYPALKQLLGGEPPEDNGERMKQSSPAELLPLGKPQIFIHGESDPYVPIISAQEYMEKAIAAGDEVEIIFLPGAGHFEPADPAHPVAGPAIREAVLSIMGYSPAGKK